MSNKSWIWKVVIGIVIAGVLVAAGFWIYQCGYRNGVAAANAAEGFPQRAFGFFKEEDDGYRIPFGGHHGMFPEEDDDFAMPFYQRSDDLFGRRIYFQDHFPFTWNYFTPFWFVLKLVVFGVFLWLIYKAIILLVGGKGWQLSFTKIEKSDEKGKKK